MIPYGRQEVTEEDIQAVVEVLRSDFLTQGELVPAFEAAVSQYAGAQYGVAVNSATSALHLACLALDLGEGDWLWTTPITFVASANCALYCGAQVDFVDIDPYTYNISPVALAKKLEAAEREGKLPKVVVSVHLCGQSCEMEEIHRLSQQYGFKIIEDAAHAIGGEYQGEKIGAGRYSDITVFSFHPVKIITTGEGGMALTNNQQLAERMRLLRSHGITREQKLMSRPADGGWYYQQIDLGFNYRMTEMEAALGLSQLQRIDPFIEKRSQIAGRYSEALEGKGLQLPHVIPESKSAFHLYVIRLNADRAGVGHDQLFDRLRERGIGVNLHYIPVHTQPYYQQFGFQWGDFPQAEKYYSEAITLPIFPSMTDQQQQYVISELIEALSLT